MPRPSWRIFMTRHWTTTAGVKTLIALRSPKEAANFRWIALLSISHLSFPTLIRAPLRTMLGWRHCNVRPAAIFQPGPRPRLRHVLLSLLHLAWRKRGWSRKDAHRSSQYSPDALPQIPPPRTLQLSERRIRMRSPPSARSCSEIFWSRIFTTDFGLPSSRRRSIHPQASLLRVQPLQELLRGCEQSWCHGPGMLFVWSQATETPRIVQRPTGFVVEQWADDSALLVKSAVSAPLAAARLMGSLGLFWTADTLARWYSGLWQNGSCLFYDNDLFGHGACHGLTWRERIRACALLLSKDCTSYYSGRSLRNNFLGSL